VWAKFVAGERGGVSPLFKALSTNRGLTPPARLSARRGPQAYFLRACLSTSAHQSLTFCIGPSTGTGLSFLPGRPLPRPPGGDPLVAFLPSALLGGGKPAAPGVADVLRGT